MLALMIACEKVTARKSELGYNNEAGVMDAGKPDMRVNRGGQDNLCADSGV